MAIINNSHKFIFVHIPKTGGTTLSSALSELNGPLDIELGCTEWGEKISPFFFKKFGISKHSTAKNIKSVISAKNYKEFFSFTIVRNPYDRVLSIFSFLNKWRNWTGSQIMNDFSDIRSFVVSDFFLKQGPDNILNPQINWVTEENSCKIVDKVYRFESFDQIIPDIKNRLGIKKNIVERKHNVSQHQIKDRKILREDSSVRSLISKRYKIDFDYLNYKI